MDTTIAVIVIVVAGYFVIRKIVKQMAGKSGGACGCGGDCPSGSSGGCCGESDDQCTCNKE